MILITAIATGELTERFMKGSARPTPQPTNQQASPVPAGKPEGERRALAA
jgi:hypothetical protein